MAGWMGVGLGLCFLAAAVLRLRSGKLNGGLGVVLSQIMHLLGLASFFYAFLPWWMPGTSALLLTVLTMLAACPVYLVSIARVPRPTGGLLPKNASDWVSAGLGLLLLLLTVVSSAWPFPESTQMLLPFREGTWYVAQGGPLWLSNRHYPSLEQRYAIDLVRVGPAGRNRSGTGRELELYYTWNAEVASPVGGVVASVVDGLPDLPIGQRDLEHPAGNHVIVETPDGTRVLMAHLRSGSVAVRSGESITVGTLVGNVGNSGYSSEPHLHLYAMRQSGGEWVSVPVALDGVCYRRGQLLRVE